MMVEIVSLHLLSPTLLSLRSRQILSWWIGCFSLFAIFWFRVLWVSASVVEAAVVPRLRWLLTFGLISLIFLIFIAVLSRLSWLGGPLQNCGIWSTLFSCTLVIRPSITSPCTGGWHTVVHAHRLSACSQVGTITCYSAGAVGLGLWEHFPIPHSCPTLTILVILLVIAWRTPRCDVEHIYNG